jgi:cytochrome c biogenesis protein CcmG, thiol:disulfide interchange protein DsbE
MHKFALLKQVAAICLISAVSTLSSANASSDKMINWQLQTQHGEPLAYQDLKGSPLILHFWATWCPYCKKLQPGLERLRKQYESQGLQVIGVSFREDEDAMPEDTLRERGIGMITAVKGDELAKTLGVVVTPTTYFITADGSVLAVTTTSDPDNPRLEQAVLAMLENQ